ncbi:hypothetical protein JL722_7808 [Aureococcus anophagefferens]|nr:hypothetical protein JL722_7808 [Aureococcus anophagefferens]
MVSGFVERLILIDKGDNSTESQYYLDLEKRLSLQFSIAVTVALKPVLADAAQTSKGLLRVYCVDVDSEPAVAAALEVTQMPTVFAVRDGALVDHIVGMPRSAEELQRFVLRAMSEDGATGANKPPAGRSAALARVVGAAALGAAGREALQAEATRLLKDATPEDAAALKTVALYLKHAAKGRPIFLDNAVYAAKVAGSAAAEGVLEAAGFALIPGDPDDDDADAKRDKLHPTHRNLAAFELLRAAVEKALATAS